MSHLAKRIKLSVRRGFTALELIIVLVVGFSIIALSASKMGDLFSSSSTMAAMNSILDLYSSTRMLRGPNGYGEQTNLFIPLKTADMLPKGLSYGTGKEGSIDTVSNEWGGGVTLTANEKGETVGFKITYGSVPSKPCLQLAQKLYLSGNFSEVKVGDKIIEATTSTTDIVTACAGSAGEGGKSGSADFTLSVIG